MDPSAIDTPLAGFLAGLVTSIHCVGMCGPLACAILPRSRTVDGVPVPAGKSPLALYHGSRIVSYTLLGVLAGSLGAAVAGVFSIGVLRALPWAFVGLFIVFLFGWEKRAPKIPGLATIFFRLRLRASQISRPALALLLGGFTPFLPCAPLYLMFGVALLTGSALGGGLMMAAFALGTVAPMWLVQGQLLRLQGRLSPVAMARIQKSLAVASILLISWRAFSIGEPPSSADLPSVDCPFH